MKDEASDGERDGEEDREEKGSRREKPAVDKENIDGFEDLSDEERATWESNGRTAIGDFLENPESEVPVGIRHAIRMHREFLPEAVTRSEALSIHILTPSTGVSHCLWHHANRGKRGNIKDGRDEDNEGHRLTGVSGRQRKKNEPTSRRTDGHLDCGCPIEESVFYLYMWKTWKLTAHEDKAEGGFKEGMSRIHVKPRIRNIIVQSIKELTGLQMDLIWVGSDGDHEGLEGRKLLALKLMGAQFAKAAECSAFLGGPLLTPRDVDILGPSLFESYKVFRAIEARGQVDSAMQTEPEPSESE